jgi:hypothetical protein
MLSLMAVAAEVFEIFLPMRAWRGPSVPPPSSPEPLRAGTPRVNLLLLKRVSESDPFSCWREKRPMGR